MDRYFVRRRARADEAATIPKKLKIAHLDDEDDTDGKEADNMSALEKLPRPMMEKVLAYVHDGRYYLQCASVRSHRDSGIRHYRRLHAGFRGLISLSICNKYLGNLVCKEFPFLWENLDLISLYPEILDSQLHAFLVRINACKVTRYLNLKDCSVSGAGLLPLMGSEVLERIDLRMDVNERADHTNNNIRTGLDDGAVSKILLSMLPYKLDVALFSGFRSPNRISFVMADFVARLALEKAHRMADQQVCCSFCQVSISNLITTVPQVLGRTRESRCFVCKRYSCESWDVDSGCPPIHLCGICDKPYCGDCSSRCSICSALFCNGCSDVPLCELCGKIFCSKCREIYLCYHCDKYLCDWCLTPFDCVECQGTACDLCHKVNGLFTCPVSGDQKKCSFSNQCYNCGVPFQCTTDGIAQECPYCFQKYCTEPCCAAHTCISPRELCFGSHTKGGGMDNDKMCACGKNTLHNAKGQHFICNFTVKK